MAVPHAVIDLDWLRNGWPSPPGNRFNLAVELTNLAAVAANYLQASAHRLVLADVPEDPAVRHRYRQAVGIPLHVARLRVDLPMVQQSLQQHHAGEQAALDWHLHRSGELHRILEAGELSIAQAASALITGAAWDTTASRRSGIRDWDDGGVSSRRLGSPPVDLSSRAQ